MRILVVDDEQPCAARCAARWRSAATTWTPRTGEERRSPRCATAADAIVLDVLMPGMDGLEVCRRLRAAGDRTPVLMLTARDTVGDRVAGLDAGADDYLVKPFALEELHRAAAGAAAAGSENGEEPATLALGAARLDLRAHAATRGGREIELTKDRVPAARAVHAQSAPGADPRRSSTSASGAMTSARARTRSGVYVGYLRRKLEAGGEPRLIHTVRGVGYVLRER